MNIRPIFCNMILSYPVPSGQLCHQTQLKANHKRFVIYSYNTQCCRTAQKILLRFISNSSWIIIFCNGNRLFCKSFSFKTGFSSFKIQIKVTIPKLITDTWYFLKKNYFRKVRDFFSTKKWNIQKKRTLNLKSLNIPALKGIYLYFYINMF